MGQNSNARTAAKQITDFIELIPDAIRYLLKAASPGVGLNVSVNSTPFCGTFHL
jgi:hypothetical protein